MGLWGVTQVSAPGGPCVARRGCWWRRTETLQRTGDSESLPRLQMPRSLGLDTFIKCVVFAKNSNEFFLLSENVRGYLCHL